MWITINFAKVFNYNLFDMIRIFNSCNFVLECFNVKSIHAHEYIKIKNDKQYSSISSNTDNSSIVEIFYSFMIKQLHGYKYWCSFNIISTPLIQRIFDKNTSMYPIRKQKIIELIQNISKNEYNKFLSSKDNISVDIYSELMNDICKIFKLDSKFKDDSKSEYNEESECNITLLFDYIYSFFIFHKFINFENLFIFFIYHHKNVFR